MNELEQPDPAALCRRCHRPLTTRLAVAAGIGGRCALLDLAEVRGEGGASFPRPDPALSPALAVAVAVATATGVTSPAISAEELVGDVDPMKVVSALGIAWSATLGVTLGAEGRQTALEGIGLAAAREES